MKFTLLLVVYDPDDRFTHPRALPTAVDSIFRMNGTFDVVVVNNTKPIQAPRTTEYLRGLPSRYPGLRLIELDRNYGCSGGFNRGVRALERVNDVLIYMSCDALVVDPDILGKMARIFERRKKIGALHPLSVYEDFDAANVSDEFSYAAFLKLLEQEKPDMPLPEEPISLITETLARVNAGNPDALRVPLPQLPLTFYAVRKDVFNAIGGFHEGFVAGWENIDFALRAYKKGFHSAVMGHAFVFHRRLLFRLLGQAGEKQQILLADVKAGEAEWIRRWGDVPHADAFRDLRYGKLLHRGFLKPTREISQRVKRWLKKKK